MQTVIWIIIAALIGVAGFLHNLHRIGVRDRHYMAQFMMVLLINSDACAVQQGNFRRLIMRSGARTPRELNAWAMLALSRHAKDVAEGLEDEISNELWAMKTAGTAAA